MSVSEQLKLSKRSTTGGILFNGVLLNLAEIARIQGVSREYLSMIFSGIRKLRLDIAISCAAHTGMDIGDFLVAFDERLKSIQDAKAAIVKGHLDRLANEDAVDLSRIKQGKPPIQRLPGLRA